MGFLRRESRAPYFAEWRYATWKKAFRILANEQILQHARLNSYQAANDGVLGLGATPQGDVYLGAKMVKPGPDGEKVVVFKPDRQQNRWNAIGDFRFIGTDGTDLVAVAGGGFNMV